MVRIMVAPFVLVMCAVSLALLCETPRRSDREAV
jgi:hypothetical protein